MTGERMDEVIHGYGRFIDSLPFSKLNYVWGVEALQFQKEEILFILQNAIILNPDEETVEIYKYLTIKLSLFQEEIGPVPIRLLGDYKKWNRFNSITE